MVPIASYSGLITLDIHFRNVLRIAFFAVLIALIFLVGLSSKLFQMRWSMWNNSDSQKFEVSEIENDDDLCTPKIEVSLQK